MMQLAQSCTANTWKSQEFEPRKDGTKAQIISTTWKLLKDASAWLSPVDILMCVVQDKVRTLVFFEAPK